MKKFAACKRAVAGSLVAMDTGGKAGICSFLLFPGECFKTSSYFHFRVAPE